MSWQVWFQNRRAKWRKKEKMMLSDPDSQYGFERMSPPMSLESFHPQSSVIGSNYPPNIFLPPSRPQLSLNGHSSQSPSGNAADVHIWNPFNPHHHHPHHPNNSYFSNHPLNIRHPLVTSPSGGHSDPPSKPEIGSIQYSPYARWNCPSASALFSAYMLQFSNSHGSGAPSGPNSEHAVIPIGPNNPKGINVEGRKISSDTSSIDSMQSNEDRVDPIEVDSKRLSSSPPKAWSHVIIRWKYLWPQGAKVTICPWIIMMLYQDCIVFMTVVIE